MPRFVRGRGRPSAACFESLEVNTPERGDPARGYEGGQPITGRKRPRVVETRGLWSAVVSTRAGLEEGGAALTRRGPISPQALPPRVTRWAANQSHPHALEAWRATPRAAWTIMVKTRPEGTQGCAPLETRGVIERPNAGHGRYRRTPHG
jgi:hypothetical protein